MSLNTAHAPQNGGVCVYQSELILIYYNGVELHLDSPEKSLGGSKKGRVYLTTHRVIFVNQKLNDNVVSVSMPFHCLKEIDVEQPVFGSNYMKGRISPEQGGGLPPLKFKLYFTHGGCIEFAESLMKAARLASGHGCALPTIFISPNQSVIILAPPPVYAPPSPAQYGFISPVFTERPPQNDVYLYEAPPPYPGCYQPTAPPQQAANGTIGWSVEPTKLPSYDDAVKNKKAE